MQLFNTLTRKLEQFAPRNKKTVTLYVCGITPYDTTHLGHAFTYVSFDVLVRFLQWKEYVVTYTQNVTDINDRDKDILKKAKEQNVSWKKLADFWTTHFLQDMKLLNWTMPTYYLKASEQIPSMINVTEMLLKQKLAYTKNGSVYLDIAKAKDFGKLSRLSKSKMLQIAKEFEEDIDNPDKKQPLDITLWRASQINQPKHIPSFASPFGSGRPGWHIECSAMAISSLGEQIDIHGGGQDLIFPHHECEVVQSESATDKEPFAKYWLHTGVVKCHGEKMSKSLGNLVMVSDLAKKYSPMAIRLYLLSHHFQSTWNYEEQELQQTELLLTLFRNTLQNAPKQSTKVNNLILTEFFSAMDNNLDTPSAIEYCKQLANQKQQEALQTALKILGIQLK